MILTTNNHWQNAKILKTLKLWSKYYSPALVVVRVFLILSFKAYFYSIIPISVLLFHFLLFLSPPF